MSIKLIYWGITKKVITFDSISSLWTKYRLLLYFQLDCTLLVLYTAHRQIQVTSAYIVKSS